MVRTMMSLAFWVDLIPTPLSWLEKCIELLWPLVPLWKSSFYFKVQCQRGSAGNETPLRWHLSLTWSSPPKEKCLNWRAPIMDKTVPQANIWRLPLTVALRLVKDRNISKWNPDQFKEKKKSQQTFVYLNGTAVTRCSPHSQNIPIINENKL